MSFDHNSIFTFSANATQEKLETIKSLISRIEVLENNSTF